MIPSSSRSSDSIPVLRHRPFSGPDLNELWLKVRLDLLRGLRDHGLILPRAEFRAARSRRIRSGRILRQEILAEPLGQSDYALLASASIFGFTEYRFAWHLPLVLSFGYDLGTAIQGLLHSSGNRESVSRLCALFNFGIATLDCLCDTTALGSAKLLEVCSERTLHDLASDRHNCVRLAQAAEDIANAELRLVLKVISAVYACLHAYAGQIGNSSSWVRLQSALLEAYQVEMTATQARSADVPVGTLIETAERKSVLPFLILALAVRACDPVSSSGDHRDVDTVLIRLGTVFSRLDDLVDAPGDLVSGQVNAFLLRAFGQSYLSGDGSAVLVNRLIEESHICIAVDLLCSNLVSLREAIASNEVDVAEHPFSQLILMYVQIWACYHELAPFV